jgi:hypothetical protein
MYYLTRILIGLSSLFLTQCFLYYGDDGDNMFNEIIINTTDDTVGIHRSIVEQPQNDRNFNIKSDTFFLVPGESIAYAEGFSSSAEHSSLTKEKNLRLNYEARVQTVLILNNKTVKTWEPIEPFYGGDSISHMMNIDNWFFYPNGTGDQYEGSVVFFITEEDLVE